MPEVVTAVEDIPKTTLERSGNLGTHLARCLVEVGAPPPRAP